MEVRPIVLYPDGRQRVLAAVDTLPDNRVSGSVTLTFGADRSIARATVASSRIAAASVVCFQPGATADHNADEHMVEQYTVRAVNINPGVSFDVVMQPSGRGGLAGSWQFNYVF